MARGFRLTDSLKLRRRLRRARGRLLAYEEFMRLPETNRRRELLGGFLACEPSPGNDHQGTVGNLHLLLRASADRHGGRVILGPFDTVLSRETGWVVQPDLVYVAPQRTAIITPRGLAGPPDLAVEVVSPSSRGKDRLLRRSVYARHGVREYWIVDPDRRTVEVLVLMGETYKSLGTFSPGDRLRSRVLPELDTDAGEVFAGLSPGDAGGARGRR